MSALRAGILVTGTEVLSGAVSDRNGPWLSRRLAERGVEVAQIAIVGDRPRDLRAALSMMEADGLDLVVTSGGLGPTADDLTVATIAEHLALPLVRDEQLERLIASMVGRLADRRGRSGEAFDAGNAKQASIPAGALAIEPVGTAPGLVIWRRSPVIVVLPGPPRELQPMWESATGTQPLAELLVRAERHELRTMRLFGVPESELAQTLRDAGRAGVSLDALEVTTCQHRGELEITTRVPAGAEQPYAALERFVAQRHGRALFSTDGASVDERVASLLGGGGTLAVGESCTGGMLAARVTDVPGSSAYMRGGVVAYSDEAKASAAGVPAALMEEHGAVSEEVAAALAEGVRARLHADVGVGVTGVAGPGGGSEEKPVGLVWIAVAGPGDARAVRCVRLRGDRATIRERAVTVAMHILRVALEAAQAPAMR
ncbi:MAG: competence/damage-inducible protein A [Solirubrobacteraceae bacterium]